MTDMIQLGNLVIDTKLSRFIEEEVAPGTGIDPAHFWRGFEALLDALEPENKRLLSKRDSLQSQIDEWSKSRAGKPFNLNEQKRFLREIGYLVPVGENFTIETSSVDPEIAIIAGPQLVVPVMNARFALNAANARWGSLYDALYGTDAIDQTGRLEVTGEYNEERGAMVVGRTAEFLNSAFPLKKGKHSDVIEYRVVTDGESRSLSLMLREGAETQLIDSAQFVGSTDGDAHSIFLRNNGLHVELQIDHHHVLGRKHPAGLKDVILEAALTTIQDCEDSVAAVDAEDKISVYRNWLGLMRGDLVDTFEKGGQVQTRRLAGDKVFQGRNGADMTLPGRSLMLVRNVGHLMTTDAVQRLGGGEIPEGFLDAAVTTYCALHDLGTRRNSRNGSIYIVKPKMHGPEEAALTNALFDRVEDLFDLPRHTIKVGVMDEERRTSVNLKETIRAVKNRIAFINTGFLDRTGDEIHTSMHTGPVVPKDAIKRTVWLSAYEDNNVDVGLSVGMCGRAQIGKGMWAKPDAMREMLDVKIGHPRSGANTAWVPSPTAAVLHALHYHEVNVASLQETLTSRLPAQVDDILMPPLLEGQNLSDDEVQREIDNNVQSILGYVVRWIDQGVGCSKVPDIDNIGLMEDRATLRISSQHIANWLEHGICSPKQVDESLVRMAAIVDQQNKQDANYLPMASNSEKSIAFQAARELIFDGIHQPNGYTEPILHRRRREAKARAQAQ